MIWNFLSAKPGFYKTESPLVDKHIKLGPRPLGAFYECKVCQPKCTLLLLIPGLVDRLLVHFPQLILCSVTFCQPNRVSIKQYPLRSTNLSTGCFCRLPSVSMKVYIVVSIPGLADRLLTSFPLGKVS